MTFYSIVTILVCHWVFDFYFQTSQQAKEKSKNNFMLLTHVATYTLGLLAIVLFNYTLFTNSQSAIRGFTYISINAVAHFYIDWVTSKATSLLYEKERWHEFFTVIGFDQLIHYITLFGTFFWLTK